MIRALALSLMLLTSGAAFAANLPVLRGEVASADSRLQATRTERLQVEKDLSALAEKIEAAKAERSNALFHNAELEGMLQKSQQLSNRLSQLQQAERASEQGLRDGQAALVGGLDEEIASLRAKWDGSSSRQERQALVSRIKALRGERESLRGAMPAAMVPQVSTRPTDDPEELAERADALLDSEDKLRREQKVLADRVAELKRERDLERRMDEFLGEQSLFDEHDRRISASRTAHAAAVAPTSESGDRSATDGVPTSAAGPGGSYNNGGGSNVGGAQTPGTNSPAPDSAKSSDQVLTGVSKMPPDRAGRIAAFSDDETLEELQAREKQIRKLADELHGKALETARQARELR